jgi:DNA-directed RNA polymerase specialized sigma24 family protein
MHCSMYAELDGYELFRKAIVEHDEQAWADGVARYRAMLISWATRCSASTATIERCDDMADVAFARAWTALSAERFAQFPNLAALLAYLRTCVTSAVIDSARSDTNFERVSQAIESDEVATPEQIVIDQASRDELWQVATAVAQTEQERVALLESYAYDLAPREILARHPALFTNANDIYTTKRNLIDRLKRSPEMRRLQQEWLAV